LSGSYTPFYRKYRPRKFDEVVGQEAVVKTLSNAIEQNRVAHAYLFSGPRGTGKTSIARIFAQSLNCLKGSSVNPCGECANCLSVRAGNAPDVIEIDAASNRGVEDARNILETVQYVPISGKYKIYIIDEVHMLTTEAFNTLLKTLEEPPQNLVFILATTEFHKVLETIQSRCQRFDFSRINQDLIFNRLKEIADVEKLNIDENALSLIAKKSSGGLRDALALLDQASILGNGDKPVTDTDVLSLLGIVSDDALRSLTDAVADKSVGNLLSQLYKLISDGNDPLQILRGMILHFRNLLVISAADFSAAEKLLEEASKNTIEKYLEQSKKFEPVELIQFIEKLSGYEKDIKMASSRVLWLEIALISILHREDINTIKSLSERITALENKSPVTNTPVSSGQKTLSPLKPIYKQDKDTVSEQKEINNRLDSNSNSQQTVQETHKPAASGENYSWAAFLETVESTPIRALLASRATVLEFNEEKVEIAFKQEIFVKQSQEKHRSASFDKALLKYFGKSPKVIYKVVQSNGVNDQEKTDNINKKPALSANTKPEKHVNIQSVSAEKYEQITQDLEIPEKLNESYTDQQADTETYDESYDDIETSVPVAGALPIPADIPEEARYVVDLFGGKIIN